MKAQPIEIHFSYPRATRLAAALSFTPIALFAIVDRSDPWFWVLIALSLLLAAYVLTFRQGSLLIGESGVCYRTFLRSRCLRWRHLTDWYIYDGDSVVLRGPRRRLVILGPAWWPKQERQLLLERLTSSLASRGVTFSENVEPTSIYRPRDRRCLKRLAA